MIILAAYFFIAPPLLLGEWKRSEVRSTEQTLIYAENIMNFVSRIQVRNIMWEEDAVFKLLQVRGAVKELRGIALDEITSIQMRRRDELLSGLLHLQEFIEARYLQLADMNRSETRRMV